MIPIGKLLAALMLAIFAHAPLRAQDAPPAFSHQPWDTLLQRYVDAKGRVNYRGFVKDRSALQAYLDSLSARPPQSDWQRNEQLAYWLNAYNAFTVALVCDHYPLKSIRDLDNGKTWDVKRIRIGEKMYSLNDIENKIIRPQFKDARIHFALNCAARSCPPLHNRAFMADNLQGALTGRTREFVNDPRSNTIGVGGIEVSKIFEWYAADFGDLRSFLKKYYRGQMPDEKTPIIYKEYDWRLNE